MASAAPLRAAALLLIAALAGCAVPRPPISAAVTPQGFIEPNANMVLQGIPPIERAVAERVARYTDFRGHSFADWHPNRPEMLVSHRQAGETLVQVHRLTQPGGRVQALTSDNEPVTDASYEPREGRYIVFGRAKGGDEANQLYRLDPSTGQASVFTPAGQAHQSAGWLRRSGRLLVTSLPLDRTAATGTRESVQTRLWSLDPEQAEHSARTLAELPGPGWFAGAVSQDERTIAFTRYVSANESEVWLVDTASGERRRVLPAPGETLKASHLVGDFSADGRQLFIVSDRAGEFRELMALDLATGALARMSSHLPWDVNDCVVSRDGRWVAAVVNRDASEEIRLFSAVTFAEQPAPALKAGSVGQLAFHPSRHTLAYSFSSAQAPSQVFEMDPTSGHVQPWTVPGAPPGVDTASFPDQVVVRWPSFDGRTISGLLNRPPAHFGGKRPVIVRIHGGPESQAQAGFLGRWNYAVQELGIAVIQPNVRGSSGYGKTFLTLDNGLKREDSVKDIGALLDWVARQPDLDASRVLVMGGSYGGYMSLAVAVHYSDRIVGAIDIVGPSNFVSFLTNTESYRRDLRRVEYGDERDPQMRAFLERIAPLNNAQRIRQPLFVVQGLNDPRVPYTESEQMVQRVRANGQAVWYLRAENEGHGFARKENADFEFYASIKFIERTLLR